MTDPRITILLVEDEEALRFAIAQFLGRRGWEVIEAGTVAEARTILQSRRPDLALLDHQLPDGTGLDVLGELKRLAPDAPAIVLTGHGSIELAVQAVKEGAQQFLTKPVKLEVLSVVIERLLTAERAVRSRNATRRAPREPLADPFAGDSPMIARLRDQARRVAQTAATVLIEGETGSGKGLIARWLHENGPRAEESLVELNCAGLSKELLESELFGYERGAFTGAAQTKPGLLEVAHRGTLFLDEIGDMSLEVQPRLLKVLEEKRFRRLGGIVERRIDVRLLAATHHSLGQRVEAGHFRADLLYRINAISLPIPPLRERGDDVLAIAAQILPELGRQVDRPAVTLTGRAAEGLRRHPWPGNIRELRNALERAVLFAPTDAIDLEDLGLATSRPADSSSMPLTLKQATRRTIERALQAHDHDVTRAARELDVSRSALYKMLRRYSIQLPTR